MSNTYGESNEISVELDGPYSTDPSNIKMVKITVGADSWKEAASPYTQVVSVDGVSTLSKVDIQLTQEQIAYLGDLGAALVAANSGGVITIYSIGGKPDSDMTVSATITEAVEQDTIWGNAAGSYNVINKLILKSLQDSIAEKLPLDGSKAMTGNLSVPAPKASLHAVNKEYVDTTFATATLLAASWAGDEAPYSQQIAVAGLTDARTLAVYPAYTGILVTDLAIREACACVCYAKRDGTSVTFWCLEDKPEADIPVQLEVGV